MPLDPLVLAYFTYMCATHTWSMYISQAMPSSAHQTLHCLLWNIWVSLHNIGTSLVIVGIMMIPMSL